MPRRCGTRCELIGLPPRFCFSREAALRPRWHGSRSGYAPLFASLSLEFVSSSPVSAFSILLGIGVNPLAHRGWSVGGASAPLTFAFAPGFLRRLPLGKPVSEVGDWHGRYR